MESGELALYRSKWALGFVMLILGLLLTTQFKVTRQQKSADLGRLRADELTVALQASQRALKDSEAERKRLQAELEQARAAKSVLIPPRDTTALELLAGTIEMQGTGVVVTMMEASDLQPGQARVSDEDIWRVLNELLAAGAEGLSVNGQRFTSVTPIRNVGQRIMVNQAMTNTPIEIAAIGDPQVLEAALKLRSGVIDVMGRWGVRVTVTRSNSVRVPALQVPPIFQYGKAAKKS